LILKLLWSKTWSKIEVPWPPITCGASPADVVIMVLKRDTNSIYIYICIRFHWYSTASHRFAEHLFFMYEFVDLFDFVSYSIDVVSYSIDGFHKCSIILHVYIYIYIFHRYPMIFHRCSVLFNRYSMIFHRYSINIPQYSIDIPWYSITFPDVA